MRTTATVGLEGRSAARNRSFNEMRQNNLRAILRHLRDHGPSNRRDVARSCGLAASSLTALVDELRARHLVTEVEPLRTSALGRPPQPIALDEERWCVLGVHVESHQVHVRVSTVAGTDLWRTSLMSLTDDYDYNGVEMLAEVVYSQLAQIPDNRQLVAVEIAVTGHVTADGASVTSRALDWDGVDVAKAVRAALDDADLAHVSTGISTDVHLAGLYAARRWSSDPSSTIAAYFGGASEVSGALVVNGEVFRGAGGGAGELAHLHAQADGPACLCGRRGCLNSVVRVQELLVRAGLSSAEQAARLITAAPEQALEQLLDGAHAAQPSVCAALAEAGSFLGRVIDNVLGSLNPHVVILGGYLARLAPFLMPTLNAELNIRQRHPPYANTRILAIDDEAQPVTAGAVLAARDLCLNDPLIAPLDRTTTR